MKQWLNLLRRVRTYGERRNDRTGVGTLALFGAALSVDNRRSFPAVTAKELKFGQVKAELACFLRGYQTLEEFHSLGCTIWDKNATETTGSIFTPRMPGDLGRIYGVQWRDWQSVESVGPTSAQMRSTDQLKNLVEGLKRDPHGRRHMVTAFNPGELDQMCLPPCHVFFQCFVSTRTGKRPELSLLVFLRSCDLFVGLPFDIASYALLQRLLAREVGMDSGELQVMIGDAHVYMNHLEQVDTVLGRAPMDPPTLGLLQPSGTRGLFNFHPGDAHLEGYASHPAVPAPMNP